MALWRPKKPNERKIPLYQKRLIKETNSDLILHNSFFISDQGGIDGVRIDYVERRQAAERMRPSRKE